MAKKVALITGVSRGIGRGIVDSYLAAGFHVIGLSRSEVPQLSSRSDFSSISCDVSREDEVEKAFQEVRRIVGNTGLDVLVNNAGILILSSFENMTSEQWRQTMATNLDGVFYVTKRAMPLLEKTKGLVVNISSLGGIQDTEKFPGLSAYTPSKAALISFTKCLALEKKAAGVRALCLALGAVNTDMLASVAADLKSDTGPADIGRLVVSLSSDACQPLNGEVITVSSNIC